MATLPLASTDVNIDNGGWLGEDGHMPLGLLPLAGTGGPAACCTPLTRAALTEQASDELSHTLKALADPARLRLVSLIAAHEGAEACVCDLVDPVGLSQPTVSHHLKVLVDAGLLTRDKRGVWAYYALVPGALDAIAHQLGSHLAPAVVR
jgi:ArsR family transcriptional regulator